MNSMGAFHEAAKLGYRYTETDVRATHGGVAVILHDRRLPARSGLPGAIDRLAWRDVRTTDLGAGESIPTLEQLLCRAVDHAGQHRYQSRVCHRADRRRH